MKYSANAMDSGGIRSGIVTFGVISLHAADCATLTIANNKINTKWVC